MGGSTDNGSIRRERSHEAKPTSIAFAQNPWILTHPLRMRSTSALIKVSADEFSDAEAISSIVFLYISSASTPRAMYMERSWKYVDQDDCSHEAVAQFWRLIRRWLLLQVVQDPVDEKWLAELESNHGYSRWYREEERDRERFHQRSGQTVTFPRATAQTADTGRTRVIDLRMLRCQVGIERVQVI
ncbi:hypothetical protein E5D57_013554 [Metarhizium anisopliae]|nr:hypothetical protein E5D57_013554 [Metarhizium anisopliae]